MDFISHSHNNALEILQNDKHKHQFDELCTRIKNIKDDDILNRYYENKIKNRKSISINMNQVFRQMFKDLHWKAECKLYDTKDDKSRLDFAKNNISVEVGFNHNGSSSWNTKKLQYSAQPHEDYVNLIDADVGIYICARDELKKYGGFDNAICSYEKITRHLHTHRKDHPTPILIMGLNRPESFIMHHYKLPGINKTYGEPIPRTD